MKKFLSTIFVLTIILTSCGPAAEDRFQMDRIAKRMSDSIAYLIDSSMKDPLKYTNLSQPSPPMPQPLVQPTAAPTATK